MEIEDEVFLVATNRKDGGLPNPVKGNIFFIEDEAKTFLDKTIAANGPHYGLYRAVLRVEERIDNKISEKVFKALEASMEEQEPNGDLMEWAKDAYYEQFELLIVASRTGHGDERLPD